MKVRAKQLGYYGTKRRYEGTIFNIKGKEEFSKVWMEEVEVKAPAAKPEVKASKAKPAKKEAVKVELNKEVI